MRFPWLKDVLAAEPPFLTVYVNTTRTDGTSAAEVTSRWDHLREKAVRAGAPDSVLELMEESVHGPSGIRGPQGRAFVSSRGTLHIDRVLPVPPEDTFSYADRPLLLPLMRVAARAVSHLLVEVDRSGADLKLRGPEDPNPAGTQEALGEDSKIEGGQDVLHKQRSGRTRGWLGQHYESRVEDSWERNAGAVAARVDRLVRVHRPDLVVLTGDVRAANLLKDAVAKETSERLVEVPGGGRAEGIDRTAFNARMRQAVDEFIARREHASLAKFHEQQSRDGDSLAGVFEVREALKRGQVDELLMVDGEEPEQIETLLHLAVETDASVQTLPAGSVSLPEGVGALLRWRDDSTPSNAVPTMSGDRRRETHAG